MTIGTPFNDGWEVRSRLGPFEGLGGGAPPYVPVTLPDDAMLTAGRDPGGDPHVAYFRPGAYEYSRSFRAPPEWCDIDKFDADLAPHAARFDVSVRDVVGTRRPGQKVACDEESKMSAMNKLTDSVVERIENMTALDGLATPLASAVSERFGRRRLKDVFSGSWFGHPLHPLLTDLPIGSWTSAMLLDLVGGRRAQPAADVLVSVGVATAVPTAITGLSDWSDLGDTDRRIGLIHATANSVAVAFYVASLVARRRGRRPAGIMFSVAGASAATAGGFLGGHLVYRRGAGVDHTTFDAGSADWVTVDDAAAPSEREMVAVAAGGVEVMITRRHGTLCGLAERCSHQGGPLHEGELVDDRVRCPWHASEFVLADGSVARGPANSPQPVYDARNDDGILQVRRHR